MPLKQGTTLFLVPRDTPGFRIGKVFNKSGWRFYQNGEMIFENARVPHANVVGDVGGAMRKTGGRGGDTTGGDIFGDLELCANALGICDDACETAMRYAKTTKQGGQVLFAQQNVQLQINKMFMLTEALRSFVMRVAWEHDMKIHSCNAGLAMNWSTDVVQEVTELYMEVRGVQGCVMDHAHRQAGARLHHLEPSRRRQRAAHEGGATAGELTSKAPASRRSKNPRLPALARVGAGGVSRQHVRKIFRKHGGIQARHVAIRQPLPHLVLSEQRYAEISAHSYCLPVRAQRHFGAVNVSVPRIKNSSVCVVQSVSLHIADKR